MDALAHANPPRSAWGDGLATFDATGAVLDCWFPSPTFGTVPATRDRSLAPLALEEQAHEDPLRGVRLTPVLVESQLDAPVASTFDAYLRLHLLSYLLVRPNEISLTGLHAHLPVNAWTDLGPMPAADVRARLPQLRRAGVQIYAIDQFPRLLDYIVPEQVQIADGGRVRLGAHLAPGTFVMHEGFINYNAGTLGPSLVEGRISYGVSIGPETDIGGGASIMSTFHDGREQRIHIGERSLVGANSGLGISLGDDCVVEAGLYVTAGTRVRVGSGDDERVVKAVELSGASNLLFRRNSLTGAVEVLHR